VVSPGPLSGEQFLLDTADREHLTVQRDLPGHPHLVRDRLWLADFDPSVTAIASQAFWVSWRDGSMKPEALLGRS
jgi:hypothetical protein